MENAELIVIAKRILQELRTLNEVLNRTAKHIDSISAEQERGRHQNEPISVRTEVVSFEDAIVRERRAEQVHQQRTQNSIKRAAWLTFLAVFAYAGITALQWREMRKATDAAKNSADAAKSAAATAKTTLDNSKATFIIEQRPYLVTDTPQFVSPGLVSDNPIKTNITYRNIGKTQAVKILVNLTLVEFHPARKGTHGGVEKFRRFIDSKVADLHRKDVRGREEILRDPDIEQDMAPQQSLFSTTSDELVLSKTDLSLVTTGELPLFCVGVISYTDRFNGSYATEFCYYFFGSDPKTWHVCDTKNTIR